MRFFVMLGMLLVIAGLLGWANYRLLARRFAGYRKPAVRYTYLGVTVAAVVIMVVTRTQNLSPHNPGDEMLYWLLYLALAWLFGQCFLILLQVVIYAVEWLTGRFQSQPEGLPAEQAVLSRRSFINGVAAVLPVVSVGTGLKGIYEAQVEMQVQQYSLTFPGLAEELRGFKIAQFSDTHLGPYFSLARLDAVIRLIQEQKPDVVVMTGDFADDVRLLEPAFERLDALVPLIPQGIYFCIGNHEYIRGAEKFRAAIAKSKAVLLDNTSRLIVNGPQPLYLLGVDYPGSDMTRAALDISTSRRQEYFASANDNIPAHAFKILLAHHPDFLFDSFAAQIPLTLAGHTHGGQVIVAGKSLLDNHAYMRGLYQENGVYGYVNSGAGHWFPLRLGCPPEISIFTLQA